MFRALYMVVVPLAVAPYVLAILVVLGAIGHFMANGLGPMGGLHEGKVNAPLIVAFSALFLWFVSQMSWAYLARPVWNARVRYFHNHTIGVFWASRAQSGNAERYRSLMNVRAFLFQLPKTGHLFRRRWDQNLSLSVAYAVLHRVVRSHEGKLPPEEDLASEYQAVARSLRKEHPDMRAFPDSSGRELLGRLQDYYVSRQGVRGTFFPIGELVQAVGNVRRTRIDPWWYANKPEEDLGTIIDGLFDRAVCSEDNFREQLQLHLARGFELRELGGVLETSRHIMHREHPLLSQMTFVVGDWWYSTPSVLPEHERRRGE